MASTGLQEESAAYEPTTVPDEGYRRELINLLGLQAAPMWSVGRQSAYERFVMDGPGLEHWVRVADAWADAERQIWEFGGLLTHLGIKGWQDLPAAPEDAAAVAGALESWIDLLVVGLVVDRLGAAMARAATSSSYAPLGRIARLVAMGKHGSQAAGAIGLRELLDHDAATAGQFEARAGAWVDLARQMAGRYQAAQSAQSVGGFAHGLAEPWDVDATLHEIEIEVDGLMRRRS